MPLIGRYGPVNQAVPLHEERDVEGRALVAFAGAERVYWAQCPRCLRRYWYALRYDTGATEAQSFGAAFRARFREEICPDHSLAPLPAPGASPGGR